RPCPRFACAARSVRPVPPTGTRRRVVPGRIDLPDRCKGTRFRQLRGRRRAAVLSCRVEFQPARFCLSPLYVVEGCRPDALPTTLETLSLSEAFHPASFLS